MIFIDLCIRSRLTLWFPCAIVTDENDVFEQYPEIIEKQLYGRELTVEIRYEE